MKKIVFSMVTFLMLGSVVCTAETSKDMKKEVPQQEQTNNWQHDKKHIKEDNSNSQEVQGYNEQETASDKYHKEVKIKRNEVTFSMQTLHF